jgi:Ca2+-binding RTX toxin-like protein
VFRWKYVTKISAIVISILILSITVFLSLNSMPLAYAEASLTVSPESGQPNTTITLDGSGFSVGTGYIWFDTNLNALLDVGEPFQTIDSTGGSFSTTLSVPYVTPANYGVGAVYIRADFPPVGSPPGFPSLDINKRFTVLAPPTSISITDVVMPEGNAGLSNAAFIMSIPIPIGSPVSVSYVTADSTASSGIDYVFSSGVATIPVGATSTIINVPINGDALVEADETFFVNLSGPVNAVFGDAQAMGTIQNDDIDPGSLQFSSATYSEYENGGSATITITRISGSGGTVTVNYATSDGTATAGSDYIATSGTLTLHNGVTSAIFTVPIVDDFLPESSETVNLSLSNPTGGATFGTSSTAVLTINNIPKPGLLQFSSTEFSISENDGDAVITVTRTSGNEGIVYVNYAQSPGTASDGIDYTARYGSLIFEDGETTQTFTIPILGDFLVEGDETINLQLESPAGGAQLGTPITAVLTIIDVPSVQCSIGYFSATGFEPCDPAPAGSYATGPGATEATLCAPGTYSSIPGSAQCTQSDAGYYVPNSGATEQTACPIGTTSTPGATQCIPLPPIALDDTDTTNEDTSVTTDVLATDTNLLDTPISVTIESSTSSGTVTVNGDNTVTYNPNLNSNGVDSYRYRITDASGDFAVARVEITVNPVNDAPTANAGADQSINENTLVNLAGTASDIDSSTLSFTWTQTAGTLVTLTGTNTATPSFTSPLVGPAGETLTFSLIVSDDKDSSAPGTVNIQVNDVSNVELFCGQPESYYSKVIRGTAGNDDLKGTAGNDLIIGNAGNDKIDGKDGNDCLIGNDGNDKIKGGKGNDILQGNAGDDKLQGQDGNDTISGDSGNDKIYGGKGNDNIDAGAGNDEVHANQDNDTILGGDGNDWLGAGKGNDSVSGDAGDDKIYGRSGNDTLNGNPGNDRIQGGEGDDTINGGADTDRCHGSSGTNSISECEVTRGSVDDSEEDRHDDDDGESD